MERFLEIERSIITSYRSRIWRKFTAAVNEYGLIKDGDRIAVCISGGKDSMLLAKCMQELKRHGRDNFETVFLVMNPGYNPENLEKLEQNAALLNVPVQIFRSDIFSAVENVKESPCYLCARMRRGWLYSKARELGCNKIALGHHFNDAVETLLLGIFYNGRFQAMMPKVPSKNYKGMELIRPLYRVKEIDIINWKNYNKLEFLNCACRFTEKGTGEDERSKRLEMKELIKKLRLVNPQADVSVFKSAYNVNLDCVIGYKKGADSISFLDGYGAGSEDADE